MASVAIHPPKTPCTKGSHGIAKATIPNVCKMPGPPAPFVPAPLPNIAKSELSPKGYSTTVKIEGNTVAIRGATFESIGDVASKGTGGGLVSANTHGPAKFVSPGSMTVKIEGKNVHLLTDSMLNNCGPSGSPPNTGATMSGVSMAKQGGDNPIIIDCSKDDSGAPFSACEQEEICSKCADINRAAQQNKLKRRKATKAWAKKKEKKMRDSVRGKARRGKPPNLGFRATSPNCVKDLQDKLDPPNNGKGMNPDHKHDWTLGGHPSAKKNLVWMSQRTNTWFGAKMQNFRTTDKKGKSGKTLKKQTGVKCTCCP
jgi:uncharacterized Zn-binding protein involved in type VI secretion